MSKFCSLVLQTWVERNKNLHNEILQFLNERQINYKLFKILNCGE